MDSIEITGGVTAPKGFKAAGVSCGLKKSNQKDLALIVSEKEAHCAGVFTQNTMAAAPVLLTKEHIGNGIGRAVVVNSGYANACTGERGLKDSAFMAESVASKLGISKQDVFIASTGVIGDFLPMDKIYQGIDNVYHQISLLGGSDAAQAIMTTDTFPKEIALEFEIDGKRVCIGGMAKGAGMIAPNMATMLAFITTDIEIGADLLRRGLKEAVDKSFNMITVDGETSTNDMVVVLANGMSGVNVSGTGSAYQVFKEELEFVCSNLARMIVKDGEGATKFITLVIKGAANQEEARQVGMAVANSVLVKTALFGEDANMGRILAAIGHCGVKIEPDKVDVYIASEKVTESGCYLDFNEDLINEALHKPQIDVTIVVGQRDGEATIWTTDLTHEYVDINSRYRT